MTSRTVDRVETLSRESFERDYLAEGKPVIIAGAARDWTATRQWSFDYLSSVQGSHRVRIEHYLSGVQSAAWKYTEMSIEEYFQSVRADPQARRTFYLVEQVATALPRSRHDLGDPGLCDGDALKGVALFAGIDTFTSAHYHPLNMKALLTQLVGTKTVTLYPPSQMSLFHLEPWYKQRSNFSRIPFAMARDAGLLDTFPKLQKTTPIECTLQPGEMLFIPDHWVHLVRGWGENLSVAFYWPGRWRDWYGPGVARDLASKYACSLKQAARFGYHAAVRRPLSALARRGRG